MSDPMRRPGPPAPTGDLTCQELVEIITDYVEGTLPEEDRHRFESHLDSCAGCRAYVDQMRKTIAVVGRLSEDSLEPRMRDELLQAFRSWKGA